MRDSLRKFGLNSNNSIIIGSGILQALSIRKSNDTDVVVKKDEYNILKSTGKFEISVNHGQEILMRGKFEIGTGWSVLGKLYRFENLENESIVIGEIRYITLDFLYRVKKSWLKLNDVRQKDIDDVDLIEKYFKSHSD